MRNIFLFLVFVCIKTGAQENAVEILNQVAAKLVQQYSKEAKELVVLHTDKKIYRAGSQIWFRAFSVSGNGYPLAVKNKIIFVDLVDRNDSTIERVLLNEEDLQFHGAVMLPGNLPEGYYQLRAYNKTIIEDYPADIFIYPVYITNNNDINAGKSVSREQVVSGKPVIRFYPEGINLVNGVNCTVYFTAADELGKPVQVSGVVKDNRDTIITNFSGSGIGKFTFQPYTKDRTYKVFINDLVIPLPPIKTGAFQLSLQQKTNDQLVFRVALGDSVYKNNAASFLVGISSGQICFASRGTGMYMVNVPLNNFPSGIADFILFNDKQEMVSKRSVFIERSNARINITTDRPEYTARQRADVRITITDSEGKPVKAAFSVAVTDNMLTGNPSGMHVAHQFLLGRNGTDLTSPGNEPVDIMAPLTGHGAALGKNPSIKVSKDFYWDGLEVKGKIVDKQNIGLANNLVILSSDENDILLQDSTDNSGTFSFRDMAFYGNRRFYVMVPAVYNKQKNYDILREDISYPTINTSSFSRYGTDNSLTRVIAEFKKQQADSSVTGTTPQWLQQMAVLGAGKNKKANVPKKGLSSHRITAETLDKLGLSNTVDAVKMIPGVIMMNNRLTIKGGLQSLSGNLSDVEPLLVIDGIPASASSVVDYLNSIPPSSIDYIEVLTGPEAALYGTRGGNGVIIVKTSNQIRMTRREDNKEVQTIFVKGFHKVPPFYIPPYGEGDTREAAFRDNRATIFWNGELITDPSGKASFSFYTADLKNDYTITVQGITDKGELITGIYIVKRK